jgi:L-Ala-D/L-Glu epimerase
MDFSDTAPDRMRIKSISVGTVRLPFRFSFKHSLAERDYSSNIIAKVAIANEKGDVVVGWGESVPRDYVTGETPESALSLLRTQIAPRFLAREFSSSSMLAEAIKEEFRNFGFEQKAGGAAWCALELALLDAAAKIEGVPLSCLFGGPNPQAIRDGITYGGVIPFAGAKAFKGLLWLYRLGGFSTVKLKVGRDFDAELLRLSEARKILGPKMKIRIDPNCAWTKEETLAFSERARPLAIASIEQPLPADDWQGLKHLTERLPEAIVVDESLCTIQQAQNLADEKACSGFNIRLSKVGGILPALAMVQIARAHGLSCHLGAQVGESGILSAAGRCFAAIGEPFENYEGSANLFLLKTDLTRENLTFGLKGRAKVLSGPGLGINVLQDRIENLASERLAPIEPGASLART